MLKKMVNDLVVECSPEEERLILMKWDLNTKYPEYSGHLAFDGVSEPYHVIEDCKVKHKQLVEAEVAKKLEALRIKIEEAQENGDVSISSLYEQRKSLKTHLNPDLSKFITIDDLKAHLEKIKAL